MTTTPKLPSWLQIIDGKYRIDPARFSFEWHVLLPWLLEKGLKEGRAREYIGRVAKHIPKAELIGFCQELMKADPAEPISYTAELLKARAAKIAQESRAPRRFIPSWEARGFASEADERAHDRRAADAELEQLMHESARQKAQREGITFEEALQALRSFDWRRAVGSAEAGAH